MGYGADHIFQGFQPVLKRLIAGSAAIAVATGFAWAQPPAFTNYSSLSFPGTYGGAAPYAGLVADKNGALYGTTESGGGASLGTAFKLTPPVPPATKWSKSEFSFDLTVFGAATPSYGSLIIDGNGALYGTALSGGTAGAGAVFRLTPPVPPETRWGAAILYTFQGAPDASQPLGGLTFGPGVLYGTSSIGGTGTSCEDNCGTVYRLTPPVPPATQWTETVLYSFQGGSDGSYPYALHLLIDGSGALYGTTALGGTAGFGTVFKLTPPVPPATQWTETILHSFANGPDDGATPVSGLIFDSNGALYGTTFYGGNAGAGTVYKLTPPTPPATVWTETILHNFTGLGDGGQPAAGVVFGPNGALYGTTQFGGDANLPFGTVFMLTPQGITNLHNFTGGTDGAQPSFGGILIFGPNGALVGTTEVGGSQNAGTLYVLH